MVKNTKDTIVLLIKVLGETALDIQHIGSTSILGIHAKPVIAIAVGVHSLDDVKHILKNRNSTALSFAEQTERGICSL